jgi:hypothetical protein
VNGVDEWALGLYDGRVMTEKWAVKNDGGRKGGEMMGYELTG